MNNQQEVKAGMNKTGAMMSPIDSAESMAGSQELTDVTPGFSTAIGENRARYMSEADPVGTVPLPATMKGMMSSLQEKLKLGNHAFLDKLGERIAFERSGTRLYEALLVKYHGTQDKSNLPPLETLEKFYEEELLHFLMVTDVMQELGGDPTAVTPAANLAAVSGMGWFHVINDPRTTFLQSLEVILQAEVVDNVGWECLIALAEDLGLEEISGQFRKALHEEDIHLVTVKEWTQQLLVGNSAVIDVKSSKH